MSATLSSRTQSIVLNDFSFRTLKQDVILKKSVMKNVATTEIFRIQNACKRFFSSPESMLHSNHGEKQSGF